ncbi:MAG: hypothetical protein J6X07_08730 [Prevotella sp.]|nr:hypothetical protein [Prevotella sp.]
MKIKTAIFTRLLQNAMIFCTFCIENNAVSVSPFVQKRGCKTYHKNAPGRDTKRNTKRDAKRREKVGVLIRF